MFFDRDGTLMHDVAYCSDPAKVSAFEGAAETLGRFRAAGYKIVVITNQSGIGRGYFTEREYRAVEHELARQLEPQLIDATYFCPDAPDAASDRRKPGVAMVFEAARDHNLDLERSFFVGDKSIDAECGRSAGVRTILVQTGCERHGNSAAADWIAEDLREAADIILHHAS
ncbi:MAG: D-glycero-alpha-D-manno-heptose-1,7-bisphosphate 7-phosphatase [Chthoniobacterales bacterium]